MQTIHRFTINGEGLFTWLANDSNVDTLYSFKLTWIFEQDLPDPFPDASDTNPAPEFLSYFTEAGYRKFRKQLKVIRRAVQQYGEVVKHEILQIPNDWKVLYQDKYQLCIKKEDVVCMNASAMCTTRPGQSLKSPGQKTSLAISAGF